MAEAAIAAVSAADCRGLLVLGSGGAYPLEQPFVKKVKVSYRFC
ncbi:MAG: hypothetical protein AB8E74_08100 [Prochlorococcus sp.]|nr:hypothetical protein [Prochlorococcaceae cyanobacterium Fu_MAG_50]